MSAAGDAGPPTHRAGGDRLRPPLQQAPRRAGGKGERCDIAFSARWSAMAVTASTWMTGMGVQPAAAATFPIESTYAASRGWAVSTGSRHRRQGDSFTLYYPTNLGAGGVRHPIVTWGNGTNAVPSQYSGLLNQLASWGFVVIASNSTATGSDRDRGRRANMSPPTRTRRARSTSSSTRPGWPRSATRRAPAAPPGP